MQFLFWAAMLCLFAAATMFPMLAVVTVDNAVEDQFVDWTISCVGAATAFMFFLVLVIFQSLLCCKLCQNRTTLEDKKEGSSGFENFDSGSRCANFQSFFGSPGLAWLLPIRAKIPEGYHSKDHFV
ncbi:hypothetical protein AAVH_02485 [Aphelenchoides avenae]|nr:hypothetical protein AAVH_02485 [Aphelenchus avenae]